MCGIAGFAGHPGLDEAELRGMADALTHRGPDDSGTWCSADGIVGFSHRRLSIIDLSVGGHQPMHDSAKRVHIAFNGEIYNYREVRDELVSKGHTFRSASDTEVILQAYREWGENFPRRLTGMFAMALYDDESRHLYLIRDRAGEKPLFVWRTPSRITFGSELKSILTLRDAPRRLDRAALEHFLAWAYVPGELCLIEGVQKLPPATIMQVAVDTGETRSWRYWDLPSLHGAVRRPEEELVEELEQLLLEAVRRQMVADVPIGILLSGGIDSSLVTAMASRVSSRPVKTFNISFPGHGGFDEAPWARIVAEHFGTEHTELVAEVASVDLLAMLARQYDEPIGDSSMVPTYLVSRAIREHATVALGGDGGDELFGGYRAYDWMRRLDRFRSYAPRFVRRPIAAVAARMPLTTRGRNLFLAVGEEGFNVLSRMNLHFSREWRTRLLAFDAGSSDPERARVALASGAGSLLQAAMRADFHSYMVDDILVKVDRASMLTSLEVRAPFLDPSVIEFAFGSVPDHLKVTGKERKLLLRRLGRKVLPPALDLTRKRGFGIPLDSWFGGQWGVRMREVLSEADPEIFRREGIAEIFAGQARWKNQVHRLFTLVMFELWRRHYRIHL